MANGQKRKGIRQKSGRNQMPSVKKEKQLTNS